MPKSDGENMFKKSYLLSRATPLQVIQPTFSFAYDEELQLNTVTDNSKTPVPICTIQNIITGSKTHAAPSDDDPDPDMEYCY